MIDDLGPWAPGFLFPSFVWNESRHPILLLDEPTSGLDFFFPSFVWKKSRPPILVLDEPTSGLKKKRIPSPYSVPGRADLGPGLLFLVEAGQLVEKHRSRAELHHLRHHSPAFLRGLRQLRPKHHAGGRRGVPLGPGRDRCKGVKIIDQREIRSHFGSGHFGSSCFSPWCNWEPCAPQTLRINISIN